MRKINLILFIIFCVLFLVLPAGCQQVPDEVKNRMENYGQGGQIKKTEVNYCTVEELRNASIEELDHVPGNLKLPKKVDFSGIESIENLVLKRPEDYDENKDKIAELFGVENPEWSYIDGVAENGIGSNWYLYQGEDAYLAVDENGEISYVNEQVYDEDERLRTVERIHLNYEACPDMTCNLSSGKIPLPEMLDKIQEWVDGCELLQDEFDYELRTVCVKKKPDRTDIVALSAQRMYKGVGLNYFALYDKVDDSDTLFYEGSWVDMNYAEIDEPYFLFNQSPVHIVEEEPVDEVIDFQSAVNLVEEELSGFSKIKVCEIRVEYMIIPQKSEDNDNNTEKEGAVLHTKPVYSFLIEFGEVDDANETLGLLESAEYVYVNVDMTDGTIITNLDKRNFHN